MSVWATRWRWATPSRTWGDNTTMTVEIPFHSADAAGLYVGQTGTLTIEGTMETVTGTIESISGADEVGAGGALIRQVKFRVSNPGGLTGTTVLVNGVDTPIGDLLANNPVSAISTVWLVIGIVLVLAGAVLAVFLKKKVSK